MKCTTCGHVHPAGVTDCHPSATGGVSYLSFTGLAVAPDSAPADDDGEWIVEGIALPYGEELARFDWLTGATRWLFEAGSALFREGAQLFFGHDHLTLGMPIGLVLDVQQTDAGAKIRAKISKTEKGREVYTLARDGVLARFSVGLDRESPETKTRVEDADSDAPLLVFESIPVWETSIVPNPAYQSARIEAVLNNQRGPNMKCTKCGQVHANGVVECQADALAAYQAQQQQQDPNNLAGQVAELSAGLDVVTRQLATFGDNLGAGATSAPPIELPASYGDFLMGLATNDKVALDFLAFAGTNTGELITADWLDGTWVGEMRDRLVERRRVLNLFRTRPLPAKGMRIEFGRVLDDSGVQVGKQVNEGDLLPYGKLAFDPGASAPVETFGGWGDMSRQVIERSDVAVVEKFFEALFNRYLQVTEARAHAVAMNPANASLSQTGVAHTFATADGWIDFVLDAAFALDDQGLPLEFLLVSRPIFRMLAKLRDGEQGDAPRMLDRTTGTIQITAPANRGSLSGQMFNLPVIPLKSTDPNMVRAGNGDAICTFEAPGAPFRLQDDDITNLTSAFSLYGYAAWGDEDNRALIRPTLAADVEG